MPCVACLPMGGFKVVFEYANRLVSDGHIVTIILPTSLITGRITPKAVVMKWLRFILYCCIKDAKPESWFALNPAVRCLLVPSLSQTYVPKSDVYFATAMQTSIYLNGYKTRAKKFYLIQGYEFWCMGEPKLHQTYLYPLEKIVISDYLKMEVEKVGASAIRIPNGFDFSKFQTDICPEERNKFSIATMYHTEPLKGFYNVLEAIDIVRMKYPQIELLVFGSEHNEFSESYIQYISNPDCKTLCSLYNRASIYVAASHSEGWGLTIGEAMICSAAVVCSNTGGYLEMAKDRQTAFISEINNPKQMADNILKLIEDDNLRCDIAKHGKKFMTQFSWDKSYQKLINILNDGN